MGVDRGRYMPCSEETPVDIVPFVGRLLDKEEDEAIA